MQRFFSPESYCYILQSFFMNEYPSLLAKKVFCIVSRRL